MNPAVNAITATDFPAARAAAKRAEKQVLDGEPLGLLHGLPLGVKDLENTAGLLTTYGSPMSRGNVPTQGVVLVERLRAAGAIVTAKTNATELGAGANTRNPVWGATGNPFNTALNAGGSSGGSAAALACDMLPVCTGSDTGGSLRIPASKCGVVGFRPTPGLVPNSRKLVGWSPISVVGPMGRTVAEACLQLAATAGISAGDPLSFPVDPLGFAAPADIDLNTLRVGWTEDFGSCDVDASIRQLFRERIALIAPSFRSCEEVRFDLGDVHRCFDVIRAESFVAGLYDVILSPTTPVSPFPWQQLYAAQIDGREQDNYYRWLALTYVVTSRRTPPCRCHADSITPACHSACSSSGRFMATARHSPSRTRWSRSSRIAGIAPPATGSVEAHEAGRVAQIDRDLASPL
ncbi:MAG: putative amidase Psyr_2260 [uncultured Paraburkholderia sp.]|nr:MAG: putative amidase Psyr_2260 [uncultured Paraburkholderia sp.]